MQLVTNQAIVKQNEFKKNYRAKHAKLAPCHFDHREKYFLDPSRSFGMTGLDPSPWRPWRSLREIQSLLFFIVGKIQICLISFSRAA